MINESYSLSGRAFESAASVTLDVSNIIQCIFRNLESIEDIIPSHLFYASHRWWMRLKDKLKSVTDEKGFVVSSLCCFYLCGVDY